MTSSRLLPFLATMLAFSAAGCAAEDADNPDLGPGGATGAGGLVVVPGGGGAPPGAGGSILPGGGGAPSAGGGAGGPSAGGTSAGGGPSAGGANFGGTDNVGNANRNPGFINLAPPMGAPLPETGDTLPPNPSPIPTPTPAGWEWHNIEGAICRDGSPTGIFVHRGTEPQLLFYVEGGGACSNTGFCRFNPKNKDEVIDGDGATILGSAGGAVKGRMQPGAYNPSHTPDGIFSTSNAANPFKDWSMVYVPYCTGDVHYGRKTNGTVPPAANVDARDIAQHQFVGGLNMEKIIGRVVPTFSSVTRVALYGVSAGAFGAALNYSMIQDAFGNTPVVALTDSGVPFNDQFMYGCMQGKWRNGWGFAFPPDCTECQQADGAGMLGLADFLLRKHPNAKIALISSYNDEIIRLFFSVGMKTCSNFDAADPVALGFSYIGADWTVFMPPTDYEGGLTGIRTQFASTNRLATYFIPGTLHQWSFRPAFYTQTVGGKTLAQFVTDFLGGTVAQVGP